MQLQTNSKVCPICGSDFALPKIGAPKKYCSAKCNSIAQQRKRQTPHRVYAEKLCDNCGVSFTPKNDRQHFCCSKCKTKKGNLDKKDRYIHTCNCCGIQFNSANKIASYCSHSCSVRTVKPTREVTCIDCKRVFVYHGRGRCYRCEDCYSKHQQAWLVEWRKIKYPEIKHGVGSGGRQSREENHRWNPTSRYHDCPSQGYDYAYRRIARQHWDNVCAVDPTHTGRIDIHHINGIRDDYSPSNLIPLCRHCHLSKLHAKIKPKSPEEYIAATLAILPEVSRNKIAELSGKAEKPIRTEGCGIHSQGQSVEGAETIIPPRGRDTDVGQ